MVERSLSMREVPGSIPGISKLFKKLDILKHSRLTSNPTFDYSKFIFERMERDEFQLSGIY